MTQCLRQGFWQLGVTSCLIWGAIALLESSASAQGQITPDNTLGAESSVVLPLSQSLPIEIISGGAEHGENLFHSFDTFNIAES